MDPSVTTHSDGPPAADQSRTLTLRGATVLGIGSMIGAGIFVLVGAAGYRRREETGSNTVVVLLAIGLTVIVLAFFAVDILQNYLGSFIAIIGITVVSVALDAVFRHRGSDLEPVAAMTQP